MKNIYLTFVLVALLHSANTAQPIYFSDTVYYPQAVWAGVGSNVAQTAQGYSITLANYDYKLSIHKTDSLGNFRSTASYPLFDADDDVFPVYTANTKLPNNRWLMPLQVQQRVTNIHEQGIAIFDNTQLTVISSKKSRFLFQGTAYSALFLTAATSPDSNSVWIGGRAETPTIQLMGTLSHLRLDSSLTTIAQIPLINGTKSIFPIRILPLSDSTCLVAGISTNAIDVVSDRDQVFIAKVSNSGIIWWRELGTPYYRDIGSFVFNGTTAGTYWFTYLAATTIDSLFSGPRNPIVTSRAVLFNEAGTVLQNRALAHNWLFSYPQTGIQLSDGSIILGFYRADFNNGYQCLFQKYDQNMVLQWESTPPLPYDPSAVGNYPAINPLAMSPTADGGFICTGEYTHNHIGSMVWLGKMDSTGCWDTGCSTVGTKPSPPSGNLGGIKVYPNPAQNIVNIETPNQIQGNLYLYNALGQLLKTLSLPSEAQGEFKSNQLNVYDLPNGIYFLSVFDAARQRIGTQRLVVQHE